MKSYKFTNDTTRLTKPMGNRKAIFTNCMFTQTRNLFSYNSLHKLKYQYLLFIVSVYQIDLY